MATSLKPVTVQPNSTVDLYAVTTIAVGTKLVMQNIGSVELKVSESATAPTSEVGYNKMNPNDFLTSAATPVGVYATNETSAFGLLQVEES